MAAASASERLVVRTDSFDDAVDSLRAAFGEVDLRRDEDEVPRFAMRSFRIPGISATRWRFTGVTGGSREEDDDDPVILTGLVLRGDARLWSGRTDIDVTRPFLYPTTADSVLDQPDWANLGIARSVVDAQARAATGLDDFVVRFTGTAPIDDAMEAVWRDTMAYTARTMEALVDRPDAAVARASLADLAAMMLLRVFPNTTLDAVNQRDVTGPRRAALRRAVQYIDDHLGSPITIAELAGAARLSSRGLFAAFRRDLDTTPMHYLRTARLTAAHRDLQAATPDATTIDAVALRWGFADPSRFAQQYRQEFGTDPTGTLVR